MAAENVISTQLTLGLMGAGLLQWLKSRVSVSFINQNSATLNHLILMVTSAIGGLGIHAAWSGSSHSLTITGLDLAAVGAAAWLWAKQWTVQFLVHRGVFGPVATNGKTPLTSMPMAGGIKGINNPALVLLLGSILLASFATGCGPKVASKAGVPARNATPLEKALAYNAGLAETNKTLAHLVTDANSQTPPLLETEYVNKLLVMQSRVADFDRQLTPLLVDTSTVTANSAKVEMLLDEIKRAAQSVQGDVGIKDAKTQKEVTDAIAQVYQFADLALTALTTAGLLK
jgi:hypothetical protein